MSNELVRLEPNRTRTLSDMLQHLGIGPTINTSLIVQKKTDWEGVLGRRGKAKEITCDLRPYHRCFRSLLESELGAGVGGAEGTGTENQKPESSIKQRLADVSICCDFCTCCTLGTDKEQTSKVQTEKWKRKY